MNKAKIKKEIEELRKEINRHDYNYYVLNQPQISDKQYDELISRLKKLEENNPEFVTKDSPTQRVGSDITNKFGIVNHKEKMYSLDNTYSIDELKQWDERVRKNLGRDKVEYVCELKIDGLSANLTYEEGLLVLGATRGDGERGEDITNNIRTIRAIPLRLNTQQPPRFIEIRGEIYMDKKEFERLNLIRQKNNLPLFANPRNAASGSVKLLESREVAKRKLNFFAHSLGAQDKENFSSQSDFLLTIKKWSMPVNPHLEICHGIEEVIDVCRMWENKRRQLDYDADGVVVKVNDFKFQRILGFTLKSPRWAVAFKFTAQQANTIIENIVVQVGRTGVVTPVAELKPVECGGVTIRNATLHNFDEIKRLDVRIGDHVVIERAGEVIPKIVKVIKNLRKGNEKKFNVPKNCPVCGEIINKEKQEDVAYRCTNPLCPAQLEKGLLHFCSREAMDIEGMGESVVRQLVSNKIVKDFADIYFLQKKDLLELQLFRDKKADNLLTAIANSKKQPLSRLLYALGIRHVGEKAALVLAERFGSLNSIMDAKKEDLEKIFEIGPVMASSIENFFKQKTTHILIEKLKKAGVNIIEPKRDKKNIPLEGMTFVFTGELKDYSRKEAESLVRSLGANVISNVSKNVSFVVVGEKPGSKYTKARLLGLKIIDEAKFKEIIANV